MHRLDLVAVVIALWPVPYAAIRPRLHAATLGQRYGIQYSCAWSRACGEVKPPPWLPSIGYAPSTARSPDEQAYP